jgi:hypothetical protein
MRAATAALVVVFCALVVLTVSRYFEQPKTITVERVVPASQSVEGLARTPNEPNRDNGNLAPVPRPESTQPEVSKAAGTEKAQPRLKANRSLRPRAAEQEQLVAAPKISPRESREIARDLRLIASKDEDDLPRLSDLMDESN